MPSILRILYTQDKNPWNLTNDHDVDPAHWMPDSISCKFFLNDYLLDVRNATMVSDACGQELFAFFGVFRKLHAKRMGHPWTAGVPDTPQSVKC